MIRLLTAVLLFASFNAVADDLKTFSDGQVIEADDFNHNFQKLEQDIAEIPTCTTDQVIVYRGGAWVCSSPEFLESGNINSVEDTLFCSSGKRVTGGGCRWLDVGLCSTTESRPDSSLSGWFCQAAGAPPCALERIYAICQ